jgi:hypothetical protein
MTKKNLVSNYKVIIIGASVMTGAELKNPDSVWPILFAKSKSLPYKNFSLVGCSPQYVLRTLLSSLSNETEPCFYIIHWPNAIRFEYVEKSDNSWIQLGPTDKESQIKKTYYGSINSYLGDKWSSLLYVYSALQALKNTHHKFAMTLEDKFVYETQHHNPDYVSFLQSQTKNHILWFDSMSWTDWVKHHGFALGLLNHPLEAAHEEAFSLFESVYNNILIQ